jgi:hypothetical protein
LPCKEVQTIAVDHERPILPMDTQPLLALVRGRRHVQGIAELPFGRFP